MSSPGTYLTTYTSNLFDALSENGRLGLSEKVIEDFLQLTSAHRGEVIITITSAKVCDSDLLTLSPSTSRLLRVSSRLSRARSLRPRPVLRA